MSQRTGLCMTDCSSPIRTIDQLEGCGLVWNKALVIPMHLKQLNPAIASIEYVLVEPGASIGEHCQATDEIYVVQRGCGELRSNGVAETIEAGSLVIAPKGTTHAVRNISEEPLGFLVIEIQAPGDDYQPAATLSLLPRLDQMESFHPARVGQRPVLPKTASVTLSRHFRGPWGKLCLVELPEGGRIEPYALPCEENLFLFSGHMTLIVEDQRFDSEGLGLNALIPRQLRRAIINRSSVQPLRLLSVELGKQREEEAINDAQ